MAKLQEEGYNEKKILNAKKENDKIKDLNFLNNQIPPVPFTAVELLKSYMMNKNLTEKEKNTRMYVEVRYARTTSLTLKENGSVFRLKMNGKNLETKEYAKNLIRYFDDSESINSLTMEDLYTVLGELESATSEISNSSEDLGHSKANQHQPVNEIRTNKIEGFINGEHVEAAWLSDDSSVYQWYIGVIDVVDQNDLRIAYFQRASQDSLQWDFPENEDIQNTKLEQILYKLDTVCYTGARSRIGLSITVKQAHEIDAKLEQIVNSI